MHENWKIGNHPSQVVSDTKVQNRFFPSPPNPTASQDEDKAIYGGYLVCESVGNNDHAKLIASAPEMLRLLNEVDFENKKTYPTNLSSRIHNFLKNLKNGN